MALVRGSRLGAYEILTLIGVGGMGEVYRARDTRLARDVAIKVLPSDVAADPDRLTRFAREAQVLASLNHPNIAAIYGVEDSTGTPALVMELVEGPTLADRIAKGAIPLDEALPIAKQITEALEAAHEQGIIHRDLKPANIKVRPDGTVKVLDFGLAKAFDPVASSVGNATMSPTLSIHATQAGMILGTAAYMAPEQARGKSVDKRADVWAFGVVLYEMLTGYRAFDGDDVSITLASVLKTDPDWRRLPPTTPVGLRRLLSRCLKKDPKDRLQAIGDARVEIGEVLSSVAEPELVSPIVSDGLRWRQAIHLGAAVLLTAILTGTAVWFVARSTIALPRVSRFTVTAPISINGISRDLAITPDGSRLIYVGADSTTLFVRRLDQLEVTPLTHGSALRDPFVSPDGQWVGFFEGAQTLKKVAITGGPAMLVTQLGPLASLAAERGATWSTDGTIIVAVAGAGGLWRVSAQGGTPSPLTRPDRARGEGAFRWPELLPGGEAVLFTAVSGGGLDAASIGVLDLRSGRTTILFRGGSHAHYVASGHLVYAAAGTLRAIPFDRVRLAVRGTAIDVVSQVMTSEGGAVEAVMAGDGTLVYFAGTGTGTARTLVWVDRQGHETPIGAPPRAYLQPRLSPDGTRIAVFASDDDADIWIWDLARATLMRLTFNRATNPVWTSDSRHVVFSSTRTKKGQPNLFRQAANGTGAVEQLTDSLIPQTATSVSPDGRLLVLSERSPQSSSDIMTLRLDGSHQVVPLVQTPSNEDNGMVSPDGRWLAYEATDSGSLQVYVRPFPAIDTGRWQVSTNGGSQPTWARNGQELFYLAPDAALMRVAVMGGRGWTTDAPIKMLEGRYFVGSGRVGGNPSRNYDVAPDGERFLMLKPGGDAAYLPPQIVVVQHFDEELKRLAPLK